jgi:hypothetical protein
MEIKKILYITKPDPFSSVPDFFVREELIPQFKNSKFEHVAWIGVHVNGFITEVITLGYVLYDGEWDAEKFTDKLMRDAVAPWLEHEDIISPFFHYFEKLDHDREKITNILKGGIIY